MRGAVEVAVPAQGAGELPAREGVKRAGAKGQRGGGQQGVGLLQLGQQAADGRGQVAARGQQAQQVEGGDGVALGEQGLGVVQLGTGQVGLQQQGALERFNGGAVLAQGQLQGPAPGVVGAAAQALVLLLVDVGQGGAQGGRFGGQGVVRLHGAGGGGPCAGGHQQQRGQQRAKGANGRTQGQAGGGWGGGVRVSRCGRRGPWGAGAGRRLYVARPRRPAAAGGAGCTRCWVAAGRAAEIAPGV